MPDPASPDIWVVHTTIDSVTNSHVFGAAYDYWTVDLLGNLSSSQLAALANLLSDLLSKTLAEVATRG
mgnify:CR=1 FL=1